MRYLAYKINIIILFVLLSITCLAQDEPVKDLDKVEILTKYRPVLSDAQKVEVLPIIKDFETKPLNFKYDIPDYKYIVKPTYSPIDAIEYKPEAGKTLKDNFLKLGFGNYTTPFLQFYLHNPQDKNYRYGLSLSHLSQSGKPQYARFSDSKIGVFGEKHTQNNTLKGQIDYNRFNYHFFGYDHELYTFKKDSINNTLNDVVGKIEFDNLKSSKRILSAIAINLGYFNTKFQDESNVKFGGKIGGNVKNGKIWVNYDINNMITKMKDTNSYIRNYIAIKPQYIFSYRKIDFDLGIKLQVQMEKEKDFTYVYPEAFASTYIVPKKMKAFLGITGDLERTTLKQLYLENPYIVEYPKISSTLSAIKLLGGINGRINTDFDYIMQFSFQTLKNLPLYLTDTFALRKFIVAYGDGTLFKFQTALNYNKFDKINIGVNLVFNQYNIDQFLYAYQKPNLEFNSFIKLILAKKLVLKLNYYVIGQRYAKVIYALGETKLPMIHDINLSADYRYKKNLSFFINVNNMINQRYQQWNNYPNYGLNAIAGFTFTL